MSTKTARLRLVHSIAPPPAELAPAEDEQAEDRAREPYVAAWMLDEGHASLREARARRLRRALVRALVAAAILATLGALARL